MFVKENFIVVIPTYNNPDTILDVVSDVLNNGYKVIVVDDGSEKRVNGIIENNENIFICTHEVNCGKGEAILTGAKKAKELGYKHFFTIDADGQHLASELDKLLNDFKDENEIIIGARDLEIQNVPNGSKIGKRISNFWATLDCSQPVTDSLSGFRLYPISILDLKIKTRGYDWEMEVIVRHAWKGRKIKETSINCYYPHPDERVSHFKKFWDTFKIVIVHVRLLPQKLFINEREG